MKKLIISILYLIIWKSGFCQVQTGINTITPQQVLQISGTPSGSTAVGTTGTNLVTPTMRVEGLNQTNNTAHPTAPTISVLPLYATTSGDLVVSKRYQEIVSTPPGTDGIVTVPSTGVLVSTSTGAQTTAIIKTVSITLARPSIVYFNASVGINTIVNSTGAILEDNIARLMGIQFRFSLAAAGSGIATGIPFASNTDSYTSGPIPVNNTNIPFGYFWYALSKEIKLPAGNYTFQILGVAAGSAGFRYTIGSGFDSLNIFAIAL